jgi:hypothetical protein
MRCGTFILSVLIASGVTCLARADSFTGNFTQDDDVVLFNFSIGSTSTVTMQTFSFAGGVNGASTVIAEGGFAPVLTLFDGSGNELATDHDNLLGNCTKTDSISGFCWDAKIVESLAAGDYTLALTEDDNTALGPTLADGFQEQGNGNFTEILFGGLNPFTLVDGSQRSNAWAVDIDIAGGTSPVPEPNSLPIMAITVIFWLVARVSFRRWKSSAGTSETFHS